MKIFSIVALALLAVSSHADDRHDTDPVRDNVDSGKFYVLCIVFTHVFCEALTLQAD